MEGPRFWLTVREVYALRSPGVVVTGVVEGGSVSVGDRVRLRGLEGGSPTARIAAIEAGPGQRVSTAGPGSSVGLLLRGIEKGQIASGDILEPPEKQSRLLKGLKTFDAAILAIAAAAVGSLLYAGACLLFGRQGGEREFLRQTVSCAAVNAAVFLGAVACDGLSKRFWRQKNERDGWDTELRVLKCTPQAYALIIAGVLLLLMTALILSRAPAGELQAAWEKGALTFPLLFVTGYNLLAVPSFLYYTGQKVFYSRCQLRLVSFGRSRDIPWAQVRSITLIRKRGKSRIVVEQAEKSVSLRSEVLADGWDDFADFAQRMADEYRIPFERRRE